MLQGTNLITTRNRVTQLGELTLYTCQRHPILGSQWHGVVQPVAWLQEQELEIAIEHGGQRLMKWGSTFIAEPDDDTPQRAKAAASMAAAQFGITSDSTAGVTLYENTYLRPVLPPTDRDILEMNARADAGHRVQRRFHELPPQCFVLSDDGAAYAKLERKLVQSRALWKQGHADPIERAAASALAIDRAVQQALSGVNGEMEILQSEDGSCIVGRCGQQDLEDLEDVEVVMRVRLVGGQSREPGAMAYLAPSDNQRGTLLEKLLQECQATIQAPEQANDRGPSPRGA